MGFKLSLGNSGMLLHGQKPHCFEGADFILLGVDMPNSLLTRFSLASPCRALSGSRCCRVLTCVFPRQTGTSSEAREAFQTDSHGSPQTSYSHGSTEISDSHGSTQISWQFPSSSHITVARSASLLCVSHVQHTYTRLFHILGLPDEKSGLLTHLT